MPSFNIELENLQDFSFEITELLGNVKKKDLDLKILFFENNSNIIHPRSNNKICQVTIDVLSSSVKKFLQFFYFTLDRTTPRKHLYFI